MIKSRYIFLGLAMILMLAGCGANRKTIRFGSCRESAECTIPLPMHMSVLQIKRIFRINLKQGILPDLQQMSDFFRANILNWGLPRQIWWRKPIMEPGNSGTKHTRDIKRLQRFIPEACQIIVRTDSEIETLDDLLGKTISIGAEESGTERNANQILQAQGISGDMVKTVNLDYTEAAAKLADGEIDAFFCTAGTQTTVIGELAKECGIRLLSIDVKCRNRLKAAYPFYSEYTIPAGTYTGQTEEVKTLSVQAVLLAGDSLSENTVKELTELLFLHGKDIRYAASIELKEDEQSAIGGITIPFHKGAAAYYAECGIEVPTE